MKRFLLVSWMAVSPLAVVQAQDLTPELINDADPGRVPPEAREAEDSAPDPAIIHLQVLLDRAGASPGVIDGLDGSNFRKAIAGFEAMAGLEADGKPDPELITRLKGEAAEVVGPYRVTPADAADLVPAIPEDYAEQAEMEHLGYTSVAEKLAERFHMDIDLLKALNPGARFAPGETIIVAMTGVPRTGKVKRIEVHREKGQLLAFDKEDNLLAVYPATIGSEDNPSPSGKHKVNGVARQPPYNYKPKINFQQGKNRKKLTLPSGPNNPVGSVWIDLSEPTYGIHGTPEPSKIDKAGSHGCVRLTNWDAGELAAMVKPGVTVEFEE